MKTQPFDAIIFDHDGTLIDTESPDFEACQIMCREQNINLPLEYWAEKVVGYMDGYSLLYQELIQPNNNGFTEEQMWQRLRELWPITLKNSTLMPGVETLLPKLRKEGYTMGVATAADRAWANCWMSRFNLLPYFEVIAAGDDVANNKPAPDVYLHAAAQLGVKPQRCLAFEDSVAGTQAAKAARMTVVAVPSHVTKSLKFDQADTIINGLNQVTVAWVEQLGQTVARE